MRNELGNKTCAGWRTLLGTGLLAALLLACVPAYAAHATGVVRIGGSIGHSRYEKAYYVSGHYETRAETVLVEPAHYEKVWVEAEYKTIELKDGTQVSVKLSEGCWNKSYVPDRYETRYVQVWVPGYYLESRPAYPSLGIGIGIGFRF